MWWRLAVARLPFLVADSLFLFIFYWNYGVLIDMFEKILIILAYIVMFIFTINIIISCYYLYINVQSNLSKKQVVYNFFRNLIFGWLNILDTLFWFI